MIQRQIISYYQSILQGVLIENRMYPISVLHFERPRALKSLYIISYEFQRLLVLFDTLLYDFGCLEAELQHFLSYFIFHAQKICAFIGY